MNNLCRLCLSACENMTELFGDENISNLVKECTGIEMSANATLPRCVCDPCLLQLYNIDQFIGLIRRNQTCLSQLLDYNNIIDRGTDLEFLAGDVDALQALALASPPEADTRADIGVLDSDLSAKSAAACAYRCKRCKKVFGAREDLYAHAKGHIGVGVGVGRKSRQEATRRPDGDGAGALYRCKVCQLIFSDRKNLYSHVKQHTSVLETGGHLCDSCGRSFNSHSALNRHVLSHTNDLFECKHCNRKFATEHLLKVHDDFHEAERKMCELCGIILSNDLSLKVHLSSHA